MEISFHEINFRRDFFSRMQIFFIFHGSVLPDGEIW